MLSEVTVHDIFIESGGLSMAIKLLMSTEAQQSTLALMIVSHLVAAKQKSQDYGKFSSRENFIAFTNMLANHTKYEEDAIKLVLSVLANLVNTEGNRKLFYECKGIPSCIQILRDNKKPEIQGIIVALLSNILQFRECALQVIENDGDTLILDCILSPHPRVHSTALAACINLSSHEDLIEKCLKNLVKNKLFETLSGHLKATDPEVKLRAVSCIANLMGNETAQHIYRDMGGIDNLVQVCKSERTVEVKTKALNAIFHMTMYNDEMRHSVIAAGLADLTTMLSSSQQSMGIKREIAKAMINMSLADDEIFSELKAIQPLLYLIAKSGDSDVQEYSAIVLENLAANQNVNSEIEKCGGYQASVDFLQTAKDAKVKEHCAKLISRFAINGKMRQLYQENGVIQTLKKISQDADPRLKEALSLACENIAVPHFQNQEPPVEKKSEFSNLEKYNLLGDDDYHSDAFIRADECSTDSESEDSDDVHPSSPQPPSVARSPGIPTKNPEKKGPTPEKEPVVRLSTKQGSGNSPAKKVPEIRPEPSEIVEDRSLKKEQYTIREEDKRDQIVNSIRKQREGMIKRVQKFLTGKGKEEDREAVAEASVCPCRSMLWDYCNYWCAGCKMDANCQKLLADAQTLRILLVKSGVAKNYDAYTTTSDPTKKNAGGQAPTPKATPSIKAPLAAKSVSSSTLTLPPTITPKSPRSNIGANKPPADTDPVQLQAAKMNFKRTRAAQELLETEGNYVRNLSIIIKKFQNPLLQMASTKKPLLATDQIRTIFSTIEILFGYNSMLLEGLNQRMSRWSPTQTIADIFLYLAEFFKVYTAYINNFDMSQLSLQRAIGENPKLSKWLESVTSTGVCNGQSIMSYLIMPVQRLPRYGLLLRELRGGTPESHPDSENLNKAIEKISNVNNYLNSKKKQSEHQFKMFELVEKLVGTHVRLLVQPSRTHVSDVEITWSDTKRNPEKIFRGWFYLFSDAIMYTKVFRKNKNKQKVVHIVPILGCGVSWQGDNLCIKFDSIKTYVILFTFASKNTAQMKMFIKNVEESARRRETLTLDT